MKPAKLGKPEIALAIGAEGGSLTLMMAEVLAWEEASRPAGEWFESEYHFPERKGSQRVWVQDLVFWMERDERTLAAIFDEGDLPDELYAESDYREGFDEALHEFMDTYQWWLLYPVTIHPRWIAAIEEAINQRFPDWGKDPGRYENTWYACRDWYERLVLKETPSL